MTNTKSFKSRERILSKGEPAALAYKIVSGRVRVFLDKDGKAVTLAELKPGAIFGETALFGTREYGAHVEALEDTVLEVITPEDFKNRIETCDDMLRSLIQMLIERQRKTNEAFLESETREFMDITLV